MTNSEQYSVSVARSLPEVEELREVWEKWQWHPNSDIDHYLTVVTSRKEIVRPHIVFLREGNEARALLIGRIEDGPLEIRAGYKVLFRPRVRSLQVVYGGLLGDDSYSTCATLVSELTLTLARREADVVSLHFINRSSYIYEFATTAPHFLARDHCPSPNSHFSLSLPKTYEEYLGRFSKDRRADFRNYSNRLSKKFGSSLFIRSIGADADLDSTLVDMETVARRTYQRGLGAGFIDNEETRRRFRLAARRKWLRTYLMYIGNQPIAFWNGFVYGTKLFLESTGFDPDYHYFRPGIVLLLKLIQETCEEGAVNSIDFGFGEADYKRVICNEEWIESTVFIFDRRVRTVAINALRTVDQAFSDIARNILMHGNFFARVKKLWRDRLSRKSE